MIKAVIFDLDGTLFDRASSVERCIRDQHSRFARQLAGVPQELHVARFLELDARGYVPKDQVYERLVEEYGLESSLAGDLCQDFYAHYHEHAVGYPDLRPTLQQLRDRGLQLGIITNGGERFQRATIAALGIGSFFDAILISEAEGIRKPERAIFLRALERFRVFPSEAVFVGDHPEADVKGARDAGMFSIWRRDAYWGECEHANAVIEELASIPGLLSTLRAAKPAAARPGA